jgi:hypothetical protein
MIVLVVVLVVVVVVVVKVSCVEFVIHTQNKLCLCPERRPVSHRVNRKMAAVKGTKRCLCFSRQCSLSLAQKVTYAG